MPLQSLEHEFDEEINPDVDSKNNNVKNTAGAEKESDINDILIDDINNIIDEDATPAEAEPITIEQTSQEQKDIFGPYKELGINTEDINISEKQKNGFQKFLTATVSVIAIPFQLAFMAVARVLLGKDRYEALMEKYDSRDKDKDVQKGIEMKESELNEIQRDAIQKQLQEKLGDRADVEVTAQRDQYGTYHDVTITDKETGEKIIATFDMQKGLRIDEQKSTKNLTVLDAYQKDLLPYNKQRAAEQERQSGNLSRTEPLKEEPAQEREAPDINQHLSATLQAKYPGVIVDVQPLQGDELQEHAQITLTEKNNPNKQVILTMDVNGKYINASMNSVDENNVPDFCNIKSANEIAKDVEYQIRDFKTINKYSQNLEDKVREHYPNADVTIKRSNDENHCGEAEITVTNRTTHEVAKVYMDKHYNVTNKDEDLMMLNKNASIEQRDLINGTIVYAHKVALEERGNRPDTPFIKDEWIKKDMEKAIDEIAKGNNGDTAHFTYHDIEFNVTHPEPGVFVVESSYTSVTGEQQSTRHSATYSADNDTPAAEISDNIGDTAQAIIENETSLFERIQEAERQEVDMAMEFDNGDGQEYIDQEAILNDRHYEAPFAETQAFEADFEADFNEHEEDDMVL